MENMRHTTRKEIDAAILFACEANDCPELFERISWSWNSRFTRRMGDANYLQEHIRLSTPLWPRASEQERYETVVHEACHLIAVYKYGLEGRGHGRLWKVTMRKCGLRADRCHNVDRTGLKRKTRRIAANCACGTVTDIGPQRAKKITQDIAIYRCNRCKSVVKLGRKVA